MKKILSFLILINQTFLFASQDVLTAQIEEDEIEQEPRMLNVNDFYRYKDRSVQIKLVKPLHSNTTGTHVFGKIYYLECIFDSERSNSKTKSMKRSSYHDGFLVLFDSKTRRFYVLDMEDVVKDKNSFYNFVSKWNFALNNDDEVFHEFRRQKNLDQQNYETLTKVGNRYISLLRKKGFL